MTETEEQRERELAALVEDQQRDMARGERIARDSSRSVGGGRGKGLASLDAESEDGGSLYTFLEAM